MRHLPGTDGANAVDTPLMTLAESALRSLSARDGVVVVQGKAGMGKTFAVDAAAGRVGRTLYWVDLTGETNLTAMYARLWHEVTGTFPVGTRAYQLGHDLIDVLSERDCVLVIDEAQWADRRLLRTARSIYDRVGNQPDREGRHFGLVLVGQNLDRVIKAKEPGLWSRTSRNIKAPSLAPRKLAATLGQYHELFRSTDPRVIADLYDTAKGNWREWAHILEAALSLGFDPAEGLDSRKATYVLRVRGHSTEATA